VTFFQPPPPPPKREPQPEPDLPDWLGPPAKVIPVTVGLDLVIGESDEAVITLGHAKVYEAGMRLELQAVTRRKEIDFHSMHMHWPPREGAIKPERLLFGVEFSDGRKATTLDSARRVHEDEDDLGPLTETPPEIVLHEQGGGGGGTSYHQSYWLWPLPPPGTVTVATHWPAMGVDETLTKLDAAPFIEAATRARRLWPDDPPTNSHGGWTTYADG
jgi:hypothetical protein